MQKEPKYSPLYFNTTVRNPQRIKSFLSVLAEHKNEVLTNDVIDSVIIKVLKRGIYKPNKVSGKIKEKINSMQQLTDEEAKEIMDDNPQKHNESGFDYGWHSRFDTWYKFSKELGFVFYKHKEKIIVSEIGEKLISDNGDAFERFAFLNSFAKYQSNNPFRRVLNENIPLILLLDTIKKLNADTDFNDKGISKIELPLVFYWKDNDSQKLYKRIKQLRKEHGYTPSSEIIIDICSIEIMQEKDKIRKTHSIVTDYTDDFIRKMRITGLITIRGMGRFIDLNYNEENTIQYLLNKYSNYEKYYDEVDYFNYMSRIEEGLICQKNKEISKSDKENYLIKWSQHYSWNFIKKELISLSKRRTTKDEILKYLRDPVRLEFLVSLAIKKSLPEVRVIPNYPVDDEGIPTSTAGGTNNTGDIECFEGDKGILVEVTMSGGRAQTVMEFGPIERHLSKFKENKPESMCYFIAPEIFTDSVRYGEFIKYKGDLNIVTLNIPQFLKFLENTENLYNTVE